MIGNDGSNLSDGQKKRGKPTNPIISLFTLELHPNMTRSSLVCTRPRFPKADITVLDASFSALDNETWALVRSRLFR
ncbi:hypothetical protein NHJ6243_004019 [Beauveria neobassiana]